MGNRLFLDAFARGPSARDGQPPSVRFRQLLLIAADLPTKRLESEMGQISRFFRMPPTV
jgi:hypothetical protein